MLARNVPRRLIDKSYGKARGGTPSTNQSWGSGCGNRDARAIWLSNERAEDFSSIKPVVDMGRSSSSQMREVAGHELR